MLDQKELVNIQGGGLAVGGNSGGTQWRRWVMAGIVAGNTIREG